MAATDRVPRKSGGPTGSAGRNNVYSLHIYRGVTAERFEKSPGKIGHDFPSRHLALEVSQRLNGYGITMAEMETHKPEIIPRGNGPRVGNVCKSYKTPPDA